MKPDSSAPPPLPRPPRGVLEGRAWLVCVVVGLGVGVTEGEAR